MNKKYCVGDLKKEWITQVYKEKKTLKKIFFCSYRERLEKLRLTTLLEIRMRGDRNETFKIIEFLIIRDPFFITSSNWKFTVKKDFKN